MLDTGHRTSLDQAARTQNQRDGGAFQRTHCEYLETHRFDNREDLERTLLRYVAFYNHQLPQLALKSQTPM